MSIVTTCACGIHVFYTFCMYLLVKIRHAKFYQIKFQSVYVFILSSVQSSLRYVSHYGNPIHELLCVTIHMCTL